MRTIYSVFIFEYILRMQTLVNDDTAGEKNQPSIRNFCTRHQTMDDMLQRMDEELGSLGASSEINGEEILIFLGSPLQSGRLALFFLYWFNVR
jgi:hypothetical protein